MAEEARRFLHRLAGRLRDGSVTSAEHRPALEAVLLLPDSEAGPWLDRIIRAFAVVYGRQRAERRDSASCDEDDNTE